MILGIFLLLIVTHLIIPAVLLIVLWRNTTSSKFHWLLALLLAATFISYFYLVGVGWGRLSYYFRILLPIVSLTVAYASFRKARHLPAFRAPSPLGWLTVAVKVVLASLFSYNLVLAIPGLFADRRPVELSFPLKNGVYHIGHGGSNRILNRHHPDRTQRYALDIGKLNLFGTRTRGIYPKDLTRYAIFEDTLYSPCDGRVLQAVDGLPDLIPRPPELTPRDRAPIQPPAGNHVVLGCKGVYVELAHMMSGSVAVRAGDTVHQGQPLGRVGNSGNTSEPHLHIHAIIGGSMEVAVGEGVPILFDGRFLVRNSLVIRRK